MPKVFLVPKALAEGYQIHREHSIQTHCDGPRHSRGHVFNGKLYFYPAKGSKMLNCMYFS